MATNLMHHLVSAEQIQNTFIIPASQDGFQVVDVDRTPMITWTTNFTRMTLSLWQDTDDYGYDGQKHAETEEFDNINSIYLNYPWSSIFPPQTPSASNWYLSMRDSGNGEMFNTTHFTILNFSENSPSNQELRKRDDSLNTFINPGPTVLNDPVNKDYAGNPVYTEGSPFKVEWETNLTSYGLGYIQDLLCDPNCSSGATMLAENLDSNSPQSFNWTVNPNPYNLADSIVFWFALYEISDGNYVDTSPPIHAHYFNITATEKSAATTTSVSSTSKTLAQPISSQTSQSTILTISTSTPKPTSSPSPTKSSPSLSIGAIIGIALGSVFLIFLLLALGFLLRKRRGTSTSQIPLQTSHTNSISGDFFNPNSVVSSVDGSYLGERSEMLMRGGGSELGGDGIYELPGERDVLR